MNSVTHRDAEVVCLTPLFSVWAPNCLHVAVAAHHITAFITTSQGGENSELDTVKERLHAEATARNSAFESGPVALHAWGSCKS